MTISRESEAEIRRLYYAEHWPIGTIARQLGVHEDAVRRVLGLLAARAARAASAPKPSVVAPYVDFIDETLKRYPTLRSTRLFDMLKSRGYSGSVRTLRDYVITVRPEPKTEAFVRTNPLIGEQAQVDWAHVGRLRVEGGERALWAFVIVLSWSRAMWVELILDTSVHSLLRLLVRAGEFFGGSTRQWLFDNAKTVVIERSGDAIRFHPLLVDLSGRMHVQLRVCPPRKANQKGRVERSIRFLRERFFAGRNIASIRRANQELLQFIENIAHKRPHPEFPQRTVADCFAEERQRLLALPDPLPVTEVIIPITADKTAFVRFDRNAYSVPADCERKSLTLVADDRTVRLLNGTTEVARHERCFGFRQRIEARQHREELLRQKREAREGSARDRLHAVAPGFETLVERWVNAGRNVGSMTAQTIRLLDLYGDRLFAEAIIDVIERGTHDPGALAILCEQRRRQRAMPVPLDIQLGDHVPERDVIPHDLEKYDV